MVLIDSGNMHNFIHKIFTKVVHYFFLVASNFQVLITDGGTLKCEGHCENIKLRMGDYHLNTPMFFIEMGSCDIVLGVGWLCTLGPLTMEL